jgi:hypothetical protein
MHNERVLRSHDVHRITMLPREFDGIGVALKERAMRWVIVALVGLLALAGCPGTPDPPRPDASPTQTSALHVEWLAKPSSFPDDIGDNVEVQSAMFQLGDLRVIGDATSADPPTFTEPVVLEWAQGIAPSDSTFEDVPVGIYSKIAFELRRAGEVALAPEDADFAFAIRGLVEIGNEDEPFEISDVESLPITFEIHVDLKPTEQPTVSVECDLTKILGNVDFEMLPVVDGVRTLTTGDTQLPALLTRMQSAFASH